MVKKLRRSKRWDNKGVASTVGTIMAIMVILALISLITNHYVPVWMTDGESSHMEEALAQFGTFKTTMDNQMMFSELLMISGSEFSSTSVYTSIKLGADGVPVFASPTHGELGIYSDKGSISVSTRYTINNTNWDLNENTEGNIQLRVPNRYYVPQTLVYENGALIRYQSDGEAMVADPQFSVINKTVAGDFNYEVSMTLLWLFGEGSASGSGMEGIGSKLFGFDAQTYENINSSIYINHTTNYGAAWYNFYNTTLQKAYKPSDVTFLKMGSMTKTSTGFYAVTLNEESITEYTVEIELKNPSDCLKKFKLRIGYVDVAIGPQKGGVEV